MEPHIYNALKFAEGNSEHIQRLFQMLLINNGILHEVDVDDIIVFPSSKVLSIDEFLKFSTKYPDVVIFWSWSSEITQAQGFFRLKGGNIIKRRVKIPKIPK